MASDSAACGTGNGSRCLANARRIGRADDGGVTGTCQLVFEQPLRHAPSASSTARWAFHVSSLMRARKLVLPLGGLAPNSAELWATTRTTAGYPSGSATIAGICARRVVLHMR